MIGKCGLSVEEVVIVVVTVVTAVVVVLNYNLISQQLHIKLPKKNQKNATKQNKAHQKCDKGMSRFALSYANEALDDFFMELSLRFLS